MNNGDSIREFGVKTTVPIGVLNPRIQKENSSSIFSEKPVSKFGQMFDEYNSGRLKREFELSTTNPTIEDELIEGFSSLVRKAKEFFNK
jgi:hypothetical protein